MKRILSIAAILFLSILITSTIPFSNVTAANSDNAVDLSKKVPLTNDKINAAWPKLPTAAELWSSGSVYWIDTRVDNTQFLHATPTNYTSDTPNLFRGGITRNMPHIWLQYNATIWVQVPINLLQTSRQGSSGGGAQPLTAGLNWAYGLYANPAQISYPNDLYGAFTFGHFASDVYSPPDDTTFVCSDVLTIYNNHLWFQLGMMTTRYDDHYIAIQAWSSPTDIVIDAIYNPSSVDHSALYSMYIRYSDTYTAWEFYWNQIMVNARYTDSGYTRVKIGNQTNVAVESNDWTEENFENFNVHFGGTYGTNYLAAVGYLRWGQWVPLYSTDHVPAAYVAFGGGSNCPPGCTWNIGETSPPISWMGIQSTVREQMDVGYSYTGLNKNTLLWSYV